MYLNFFELSTVKFIGSSRAQSDGLEKLFHGLAVVAVGWTVFASPLAIYVLISSEIHVYKHVLVLTDHLLPIAIPRIVIISIISVGAAYVVCVIWMTGLLCSAMMLGYTNSVVIWMTGMKSRW